MTSKNSSDNIMVRKHPDPRLKKHDNVWQAITPLETFILGGTKTEAQAYAKSWWYKRRQEFLNNMTKRGVKVKFAKDFIRGRAKAKEELPQ